MRSAGTISGKADRRGARDTRAYSRILFDKFVKKKELGVASLETRSASRQIRLELRTLVRTQGRKIEWLPAVRFEPDATYLHLQIHSVRSKERYEFERARASRASGIRSACRSCVRLPTPCRRSWTSTASSTTTPSTAIRRSRRGWRLARAGTCTSFRPAAPGSIRSNASPPTTPNASISGGPPPPTRSLRRCIAFAHVSAGQDTRPA